MLVSPTWEFGLLAGVAGCSWVAAASELVRSNRTLPVSTVCWIRKSRRWHEKGSPVVRHVKTKSFWVLTVLNLHSPSHKVTEKQGPHKHYWAHLYHHRTQIEHFNGVTEAFGLDSESTVCFKVSACEHTLAVNVNNAQGNKHCFCVKCRKHDLFYTAWRSLLCCWFIAYELAADTDKTSAPPTRCPQHSWYNEWLTHSISGKNKHVEE